MNEEPLERLNRPEMEYYKKLYSPKKKWDGNLKLEGKRVAIYAEQGFGDIIQFARYFNILKRQGCHIILHCPKELHRLFLANPKIDEVADKNEKPPPHDLHVLSMSLPFLLGRREVQFDRKPYIIIKEKADLKEFQNATKIGIAWEGSPGHTNNLERSCPLKYFKQIVKENTALFMLANQAHLPELIDPDLDLYSIEIKDFYDTATLINAVDFVVSVDTAILHLAGAMSKKTYGLFSYRYDPRWETSKWYKSITFIRQKKDGDWQSVFDQLKEHLERR